MNPELAAELFKNTIVFSLYVVAPFLGVTLVVGLVTSLVQAVTSLQEPTLSFAPKILALAGAMVLLAPWLLRTLSEFAIACITRMGTMAH
jgi:flagellar biosynthetic protein FliQ